MRLAGLQLGTEDSQLVYTIVEAFEEGASAISAMFEVATEPDSAGGT